VAQVNSSPGQNQVFANAVVATASSSGGASDSSTKANAITVPYKQAEPGKQPGDRNPLRS
jgi:hypothetical protein